MAFVLETLEYTGNFEVRDGVKRRQKMKGKSLERPGDTAL